MQTYIFFLVEWAKIYTIEEGVWNILNIFRFLFLSNFTDKLYVTFEKKGGGTAFQNLFFGINIRIESTYEYGGTSPPPPTPAFLRPVFQNEQGKIYMYYVCEHFHEMMLSFTEMCVRPPENLAGDLLPVGYSTRWVTQVPVRE